MGAPRTVGRTATHRAAAGVMPEAPKSTGPGSASRTGGTFYPAIVEARCPR